MKFIIGLSVFLIFILRAVILWVLVPYAFLAWVLVYWWALKASLSQAVCWHDTNLFAVMFLGPFVFLREIKPELSEVRFLRYSEMADVTPHAIVSLDVELP